MRYILNNSGYIEAISFNNVMTCNNKSCTEYTGSVPTGYESLENWSENANINAYKIVDGNLTYDSAEDTRLQALWESQTRANNGTNYSTEEQIIGTWIDGKPVYRKVFNLELTTSDTTGTRNKVAITLNNIKDIISINGKLHYTQKFSDSIYDNNIICNVYSSTGTFKYSSSVEFNYKKNELTWLFWSFDADTNTITIKSNIILEYTKTTD